MTHAAGGSCLPIQASRMAFSPAGSRPRPFEWFPRRSWPRGKLANCGRLVEIRLEPVRPSMSKNLIDEINEWIAHKRKRLDDYETGKLTTKEMSADGRLLDSTDRTIREFRKDIAEHKTWAEDLAKLSV